MNFLRNGKEGLRTTFHLKAIYEKVNDESVCGTQGIAMDILKTNDIYSTRGLMHLNHCENPRGKQNRWMGPITHSLFNSRSSTCETIANAALRFGERLGEKGRQVWDPSEQTVSPSWVEGYRLRKGVRSMVRYEEIFGNCFCTTYAGCIKSLKLRNQSETAQLQCSAVSALQSLLVHK